jgi:nucleoside-diphosphate-sugar epimerase
MHGLIVGCGYLGRRVARLWLDAGHTVSVLTRSPETAEGFAAKGIQAVIGDVTQPESLTALPDADVLLFAVGHDRSAPLSQREVYVSGLQNTLAALCGRVRRVLYISSTSVYGQSDGSWVDEQSPTEPVTESGRICLAAEHVLTDWAAASGTGALILRLAGIYGPGRLLARVESLRRAEPLAGSPEAWLNLIHVDDAARIAAAFSGTTHAGAVLVTDDRPVTRGEFYTRLTELLRAPPPSFDAMLGSRTTGLNKRCRNARLRRDCALPLRYPDYTHGLSTAIPRSTFD